MEIQFNCMEIPYLLPVVQRVQNLEETQELRINDGMPDIGCVLGAWGQVLLRGKEWNAGRVGVSGGVMVWALYQPEDGGEVQCVESWVPFQAKWDFTDTGKEGKLRASCLLNGIDVRSISARKLMLRVGIGISCDAGVPEKICVPVPEEQEDIYLLQKEYPLQIPVETGEKMFTVNEEITVPGNLPGITKLLRYELRPELTDQKVLGNKAVFRGAVILHILYLADDGQLHSWECDLPFSQYTELDGDFSESAQASFWIAVTNLELEIGESRILRLQGGLTAQYTIFERKIVAVAEDAYSTEMKTCLKQQTIQIPTVLDMLRKTLESDAQQTDLGIGVADVAWYPDYPEIRQEQDHAVLELSGIRQVLYYDSEGKLQSDVRKLSENCNVSADSNTGIMVEVSATGKLAGTDRDGGHSVGTRVELCFTSDFKMDAVTGLDLTEDSDSAVDGPSLILRRYNGDSLWCIAKKARSSVNAIMDANDIAGEPQKGKLLLIPVLKHL